MTRQDTVRAALQGAEARLAAAGVPTPGLDARLLLRTVAGWSEAELIAGAGDALPSRTGRAFRRLIARRARREPLQHLTGTVEFFGLELAVGPGVLIPRPDTETLVEAVLARLDGRAGPLRVADVGCGSGAVGIALASRLGAACVVSLDDSAAALAVAGENVRRHDLERRVPLAAADLLTCLPDRTLDGVVANLPYIPDAEIENLEPEVRDHEPRHALAGGRDGLDPLRRLAPMAARALRPDGLLAVEIGAGQQQRATGILRDVGFGAIRCVRDLSRLPRVLVAAAARTAPPSDRIET